MKNLLSDIRAVEIHYSKNAGGQWAMAMFVEATETSDESKRKQLMDEILKYNEEDLAATWAVFEWLRAKVPAASPAQQ
jgi:predicted RecB family nuclease